MSNWFRALSPALILIAAGCSLGPIEDYDSFNFTRPPEIWERNGAYYLRVYETDPSGMGTAPPSVEFANGNYYVFIWGRHSNGSSPNRLFDLGVPATTSPPPRFFWINTDQSRVPMEILKR